MANATPQPSLFTPGSPSMAVGGGAAATEAVPSAISTPSPTTSSSGDSTSASTDYFFGFIVAFVVLLLLFVSCGFGSRRRSGLLSPLWARNNQADHEGADDDGFGGGQFFGGNRAGRGQAKPAQQTVPVFWETWLFPRPDERVPSRWKDLQPLSATFVRTTPSSDQSKIPSTSLPLPAASDPPTTTALQIRPSIFHLLQPWIASRHLRAHPPELPPQPSLPPPNAIKLAVMISMPSPVTSQQYVQGLGEGSSTLIYPTLDESISGGYEIGLIQLPWTSGEVK
ncbi:hypothetical protein EDD15DRAFT_495257 [Pisolithus albus]|nr:hypothetical protein EDD15DRAFT_495257 [Pisolithus albus]